MLQYVNWIVCAHVFLNDCLNRNPSRNYFQPKILEVVQLPISSHWNSWCCPEGTCNFSKKKLINVCHSQLHYFHKFQLEIVAALFTSTILWLFNKKNFVRFPHTYISVLTNVLKASCCVFFFAIFLLQNRNWMYVEKKIACML